MNFRLRAAAFAAFTIATPALAVTDAQAGLQAMRELNLIVLGNLTGAHDIEGKSFIGGNVSGNSFTAGLGASANSAQGAYASARATITIGGSNTASSINLNNGNIYGGTAKVATTPGALIGGNSGRINFNSISNAVGIGGDLDALTVSSGSTVDVGGNAGFNGGINLGQNSTVRIGGNARDVNGASGASLRVGGTISGNANANGATIQTNQGIGFNAPVASGIAAQTATLDTQVTALSAALGNLTLASNPSTITFFGSRATFNAVDGGNGFALFNVGPSIFNSGEFDYNFASSTLPVIINVSGAASYTWLANPVGGNNASANGQVIWNFLDATRLDIQRLVHGSILAPKALLSNNTPIEGSVVARDFNQGGEVHLGTYAEADPFSDIGPIPEPATWAMLIAGFGLVGAMQRRQRFTARA